jgi:hypothetical protein
MKLCRSWQSVPELLPKPDCKRKKQAEFPCETHLPSESKKQQILTVQAQKTVGKIRPLCVSWKYDKKHRTRWIIFGKSAGLPETGRKT